MEEQIKKEWEEYIEKYGIEVMTRWFGSIVGYQKVREDQDYEIVKERLRVLIEL